ncbi:MAG: tetratricopeptide repeat protein [Chloroflexi bacterium]|nr:tetratricopeptide repeat protein [Chloroflexota bacterium]
MGSHTPIPYLEKRLTADLTTSERIDTLLQLAELLLQTDPVDMPRFFTVVQEAYDLCQIEEGAGQPNLPAFADVLKHLSYYYRAAQNNYHQSLSYARQALALYETLADVTNQAHCHLQIAFALTRLGSYAKAFSHLQENRTVIRQSAEKHHVVLWWRSLGKVYYSLGETDRGYSCLQTAVNLSSQLEDIFYQILCLGSLIYHLRLQGQFQESAAVAHQALQLAEEHGCSNQSALASIFNNLGLALLHLGQTEEARHYLQQSQAICDRNDFKLLRQEMLRGLGELALEKGQVDTALTYFQQALPIAQASQMPEELILCHQALVRVYEQRGDTKQAYHHFRQAHELEIAQLNDKASQRFQYLAIRHRLESLEQENEALRELHREKDELLNLVAHNLGNPLSSIQMTLDVLERGWQRYSVAEVQHRLQRIRQSVDYMTELTAQLLDMDRLDKGESPITVTQTSLQPMVEQYTEQFVLQAANKGIHLAVDKGEEDIYVLADKRALAQILENLLSNAIKFSLPQTKVNVKLNEDAQYGYISVQDEGPGLSPHDREQLFHKFARLSATPTGKERSIGLGLYITKKMVEMMNGRIWAESAGKGKGSIFTVQLPLAEQMAA